MSDTLFIFETETIVQMLADAERVYDKNTDSDLRTTVRSVIEALRQELVMRGVKL